MTPKQEKDIEKWIDYMFTAQGDKARASRLAKVKELCDAAGVPLPNRVYELHVVPARAPKTVQNDVALEAPAPIPTTIQTKIPTAPTVDSTIYSKDAQQLIAAIHDCLKKRTEQYSDLSARKYYGDQAFQYFVQLGREKVSATILTADARQWELVLGAWRAPKEEIGA